MIIHMWCSPLEQVVHICKNRLHREVLIRFTHICFDCHELALARFIGSYTMKDFITLPEINHPAMKIDCVSDISIGRHHFNLWHNTLEMILYLILHRLISRSFVILVGLCVFGIKYIFVMFNLAFNFPFLKKIFTRSRQFIFMIGHECWKKSVSCRLDWVFSLTASRIMFFLFHHMSHS